MKLVEVQASSVKFVVRKLLEKKTRLLKEFDRRAKHYELQSRLGMEILSRAKGRIGHTLTGNVMRTVKLGHCSPSSHSPSVKSLLASEVLTDP